MKQSVHRPEKELGVFCICLDVTSVVIRLGCMHKHRYCLPLAAVDWEVNFQPGLAPLSLQFPPNPSGFVNLFTGGKGCTSTHIK